MRKLASWATIEKTVQDVLDKIAVDQRADAWGGRKNAVKAFKAAVQDHGALVQENQCAWCALLVGAVGHRTAHADHIAPKRPYGKWTFEARNIAISCEYCNGFEVKGALNTVAQDADNYEDAVFHIVHPYFDEVDQHIGFVGNNLKEGILVHGLTAKGRWTIENMKLDSTHLTNLRARDYSYLRDIEALPDHYRDLFKMATARD